MSFRWILTEADKARFATNGASIKSHIMTDNCKNKWKLELYNGYMYLQIKIHPVVINIPQSSFFMNYEISLQISGKAYGYHEDKKVNVNTAAALTILEFPTEELISLMVQPRTSIEIIFLMEITVLANKMNIHPILQEIPDFEKLLNDPKFSDFIIICSGKEFRVHKNILAARSEVFSAMFELDMKERNEGKVVIEDFTLEVVQELLRFIYCGKVENLTKLAMDLLRAAKKYCLEGLVDMCLKSICKTMNTKNALKLLSLADDYNANAMKSKIINFIVWNLKEIKNQPEFKALSDPSSVKEILDKTTQLWV